MFYIHNKLVFLGLLIVAFSCSRETIIDEQESTEISTPDWTEQTHGIYYPDFSTVFPSDKVNRVDIVIESQFWEQMNSDLQNNLNSGAPGPGGQPLGERDFDPVWVPADFYFQGKQWYKVGIRFKGNSSLRSTLKRGLKKFPFKLDFDQFEDTYPAIQNQRFYGFKQLSLKNNFEDQSLMREKVATDLFADFGLISPHTAFCRVYVDFGEGPQYFGLYTMVEEVDDTVIKTQYESDDGNLYKPEGPGAAFAAGSFRILDMNKKTNETENDYSDIQNLYDIVNSPLRETDSELWKNEITKVFDVSVFLKWLAANTVMQNWDTYGRMTHNYYLYNNPGTEKLEWIPWDNNEALQDGKMQGALSVSLNEVGNNRPLIRYIIDNEEWKEIYKQELANFVHTVFYAERMDSIYDFNHELLFNYVVGDSGEQAGYSFLNNESDFDAAINFLKQHVIKRNLAVQEYLSE